MLSYRTLEKEPGRRFQQASEIRSAVESVAKSNAGEREAAYAHADHNANRQPQPKNRQQADNQHANPAAAGMNFARFSLPFTIPELYAGCACAYGIAHIRENGIELEYEIRDEVFGSVTSGAKRVFVPASNIVAVRFIGKMFSTRLEIQTDRLDVANDVPNSKQGRFSLKLQKSDRERAEVFATELTRIAGIASPPNCHPVAGNKHEFTPAPPAPPVKSKNQDTYSPATEGLAGQSADASNALTAPQIGLSVAALIDLIWGIKHFANGFRAGCMDQWAFNFLPNVSISVPSIGLGGIIAIVMAIWIFSVAQAIKEKRDYKFVIISSVIFTMTGFHPAYSVTLIFAIWTIIVVLDPNTKARFADTSSEPEAPNHGWNTSSSSSGVVLTILGLVALAFVGLVITGLLWMAMSYKANKSIKPTADRAAVESFDVENDDNVSATASASNSEPANTSEEQAETQKQSTKDESPTENQKSKKADDKADPTG